MTKTKLKNELRRIFEEAILQLEKFPEDLTDQQVRRIFEDVNSRNEVKEVFDKANSRLDGFPEDLTDQQVEQVCVDELKN